MPGSDPQARGPESPYSSARTLLRRAVWVTVIAVIATFIVVAVVSQVAKLPKIDWHFSPGWLALSCLCVLLFQGIHAETWRRILYDLHGDIPRRKAWVIWNVSLLARYVPTQVLMAVTRVTMSEREGVPKRITIASIVYEVALVTAASVVVAAWGFTELPRCGATRGAISSSLSRWFALACLHPRVFSHVSERLLKRFGADTLPSTLSFWHRAAALGRVHDLVHHRRRRHARDGSGADLGRRLRRAVDHQLVVGGLRRRAAGLLHSRRDRRPRGPGRRRPLPGHADELGHRHCHRRPARADRNGSCSTRGAGRCSTRGGYPSSRTPRKADVSASASGVPIS